MSFAITTPQFLDRSKTVTRRLGWKNLRQGTIITGIEKGQGLKRGERVRELGTIRATHVWTEPLDRMLQQLGYGCVDVMAEGFPGLSPSQFVEMFCKANRCVPSRPVRRIAFEYLVGFCGGCNAIVHTLDEGAICATCHLVVRG